MWWKESEIRLYFAECMNYTLLGSKRSTDRMKSIFLSQIYWNRNSMFEAVEVSPLSQVQGNFKAELYANFSMI